MVDVASAGNWQRGGGKGPRPRPVPRPGVKPTTEQVAGEATYTLDEMRALLDKHTIGR